MVYVVTLTNPLASGHDGSWQTDLLMEAVVGELPAASPSPPPATREVVAPPDHTGIASGGGGGGSVMGGSGIAGGTSVAKSYESPPPIEDVSDDDLESSADEKSNDGEQKQEQQQEQGEANGGDSKGGLADEGTAPADGDRDEMPDRSRVGADDEDLEISDDEDESAHDTDVADGGDGQGEPDASSRHESGNNGVATGTGLGGAEGEQVSGDEVSSDEVSSEDEPIATTSGGQTKPDMLTPSTPPAWSGELAPGIEERNSSPTTPRPPPPPPPPMSPAAPLRPSPSGKFESPNSVMSLTAESADVDDDGSDSSFDESDRASGSSSEAETGDDSDGYEVDVPCPPCSMMHKERKTYKQSLCKECYETYTRDLARAGANISDIDSETGRPKKKSPARRRRQRTENGVTAGKQGVAEKRSRRSSRASNESSSSNGDRKKRRKVRAATRAPVARQVGRRHEKNPHKQHAAGSSSSKGKGKPAGTRRRLIKKSGVPILKDSSSDAPELGGTSADGSDNSSSSDDDRGDGGPRDNGKKRVCVLRRTAVKSSTGRNNATKLADGRTEAAVAGAAPAVLPARSSNKKHSSRQGRAGASATLARGGGGDDLLGALMDNATMSRTSSLELGSPPQQGSRPRLQKRRSVDALQGRASTTAKVTSTGVEGHPQLARGQSLDTSTSRRGGSSLTARNALRPGASGKREVPPLGAIPGSTSKVSGTNSHAEAGSSSKQEKRREAERSDRQRPKPTKKGKSGEPENTPAPIAKKPAYQKVPHFIGVVRKVSNGKFFLWVHDKLHDGKPYDSAEICAKEYDKLTRPARGSHRGPTRNFGDARAPSHTEIPGLTPLSLSGSGGSRIAKKSLTSAYKHSSAAPNPKPMAKKAFFFSPKEGPPQALRQQARPPAAAPSPTQPTAASKAQLPPPPIVQSYYVSNIDLPMLPRPIEKSDSNGASLPDKPDPDKPDSRIRWAAMKETFRPVDGLHVPNDREALPRRSGLTGGRGGRPAPDTRFMCAQTGTSLELLREDSSGVEGTGSGSNAASSSVKTVTHQEVSSDNAASSSLSQNGLDAMVAAESGPAPDTLATPPQPAGAISRTQVHTTAPTPPLAVGAHSRVRAPALGESLRTPSPPTPPTAQVGQNAGNHLRTKGSPWQQAARDMEENRDEEQGRELLQSMMMSDEGGGADTEPRNENADEEEEEEAYTGRSPDPTAAENAGDEQLPFSEENTEHSDASQPAYSSPTEEPETRGESDTPESELSHSTIVAKFEKFLAEIRKSEGAPTAEVLALSHPAPEMTDEGTSPECSSPSSPAATKEDDTGAGGGVSAVLAMPSPPVAQVPWRAPAQLSRHVDIKAAVEPALPQRTPWVQPRRIGGVPNGVSSFSTNTAGIPSPPVREAQLRDGNDVAQGLPDVDEMPSPRELPLFPSETVQRVVWRPPGRFAGAAPAGIPAPFSSSPSSSTSFPNRLSEGQEEKQIPPQVLHLPLKIAGLLGEGAVANPPAADADVSGDRPHVPWRPPNRLAPSPPPAQHVVPPSSSSSMERPSNERDESAETERAALPLCRSFACPPSDERDDAPDHQWKNLLYNATRFVPTAAETGGGAAGEEGNRTEETGVEPQPEATGHPQSDSQGREQQRSLDGRQDITSRGGGPEDEQRPRRSRDDFRPSARSSRPRSRSGSPRRPTREGGRSSSRSGQRRDSYGHHERPRSRDRYSRREPGVDYYGRSLSRGSSNSSSSRSSRRGEGRDYHHRRDDFSSRRDARDERGYNSLRPPPGESYGWGAKRPRWEESRPSHRDWGR